jgi:hypothetical protein
VALDGPVTLGESVSLADLQRQKRPPEPQFTVTIAATHPCVTLNRLGAFGILTLSVPSIVQVPSPFNVGVPLVIRAGICFYPIDAVPLTGFTVTVPFSASFWPITSM